MSTLTITNSFSANTLIKSSEINTNFSDISTWANGNVGTNNIAAANIATAMIADAAVTAAKGGTGVDTSASAQGGVLYLSATGTWAVLGVGTSGRVLKTQGASANPTWADSLNIGTNAITVGDGSTGDVTITFDGDAGTDGTHIWDVSADMHQFNGSMILANTAPSGWHSTVAAFQIGGYGAMYCDTSTAVGKVLYVAMNSNFDTDASDEYIIAEEASQYYQSAGTHNFRTAAAGSAGDDITWGTSKLSISVTGVVNIDGLTASNYVKTDASKNLVSSATFTAGHYYPKKGSMKTGDAVILIDGKIEISKTPKDPRCVGIYVYTQEVKDSITNTMQDCGYVMAIGDSYSWENTPTKAAKHKMKKDKLNEVEKDDKGKPIVLEKAEYKSVRFGAGFNVCDEGGAVKTGTLLCTSSKKGMLMAQDDDILRSYTVAKSMEDVTFVNGKTEGIYGYFMCG